MRKMIPVFFWILLTLGTVTAQTGKVKRPLEPWMTGLLAVAGFLFIVFVAFLVNKAWFGDSSPESSAEPTKTSEFNMTNGQTYSRGLDMVRSSDHENAYENGGVQEMDDTITTMCSDHENVYENREELEVEDKITAM